MAGGHPHRGGVPEGGSVDVLVDLREPVAVAVAVVLTAVFRGVNHRVTPRPQLGDPEVARLRRVDLPETGAVCDDADATERLPRAGDISRDRALLGAGGRLGRRGQGG